MTRHRTKNEGHLAGVAIDIFAHPRYWREKFIGTRSFLTAVYDIEGSKAILGRFMRELGYKLSFRFLW